MSIQRDYKTNELLRLDYSQLPSTTQAETPLFVVMGPVTASTELMARLPRISNPTSVNLIMEQVLNVRDRMFREETNGVNKGAYLRLYQLSDASWMYCMQADSRQKKESGVGFLMQGQRICTRIGKVGVCCWWKKKVQCPIKIRLWLIQNRRAIRM